jgi:hypothetical protein
MKEHPNTPSQNLQQEIVGDGLGVLNKNNQVHKVLDFSQETLSDIYELKKVLQKIRRRMNNEGYKIIDGKAVRQ